MAVAKKLIFKTTTLDSPPHEQTNPVRVEHITAMQELAGNMKAIKTYLHEDHNLGKRGLLLESINDIQEKTFKVLNEAIYSCEKYCDIDFTDLIISMAESLTGIESNNLEVSEKSSIFYNISLRLAKHKNSAFFCSRDIQVIYCCHNALRCINDAMAYIERLDLESAWEKLGHANRRLGGARSLLSADTIDIEAMINEERDEKDRDLAIRAEHGRKFSSGRTKDQPVDDHLRHLKKIQGGMKVKQLFDLADQNILKDMTFQIFKNRMSLIKLDEINHD